MKKVYLKLFICFLLTLSFYSAQTQVADPVKKGKLTIPANLKKRNAHSIANFGKIRTNFNKPVKKGDTITVKLVNFDASEITEITVINMIGKQIMNDKITKNTYHLDVNSDLFVDGIYLVKIKQGEKKKVERLVVK